MLPNTQYNYYDSAFIRDNILLDATLLTEFSKAVQNFQSDASMEVIKSIHRAMLDKMYNVRCNEFLRTVTKTDCIKKKGS